jgi:hypothetical protein
MPRTNIGAKRAGKPSAKHGDRPATGRERKGKKKAPSPENSEIPAQLSKIFFDLMKRREGPPGPRIAIGDALRERGLDEHTIADTYVHVIAKLTSSESDGGGVQKLLVDVLKECSRQIETSQPPMRSANPDAPVIVQLVHTVARPARAALPPAPGS